MQPLKYWVPEQQQYGDKHVYGAKSRFLTEKLCTLLEPIHYPRHDCSQAQKKLAAKMITDIKKTVLGIWQEA